MPKGSKLASKSLLKGYVRYIFGSFKTKRKHLSNKGKVFFISLEKLFSLSRKSNFRILHFQISWRHQMPN